MSMSNGFPTLKDAQSKFCVNCRHFTKSTLGGLRCHSPRQPVNLVTGKTYVGDCEQLRDDEDACGRGGKWFELAATP